MRLALLALAATACASPQSVSEGRFASFGSGLPTSGQWREGFRVADMNRDGHPDIVLAPARKRPGAPPLIFLGDGKGSFTRWKAVSFPPLAYDYGDVEVADFNGDGVPDLALAVHLSGLLVLLGDGNGNFRDSSAGLDFGSRTGFSSRALRIADWNGDGRPDLIASSEGPQIGRRNSANGIAVFLNQGVQDGAVTWQQLPQKLGSDNFSDSLVLADIDGDGHIDAVTGSTMMGRKDLVTLWRPGGESKTLTIPLPELPHYVYSIAPADFDGDGKTDLAVVYTLLEDDVWYSACDVLYARPNGAWERKTIAKDRTREGFVAVAAGRFRHKARVDLVATTMLGEAVVFLNDGRGAFTQDRKAIPPYQGCRASHAEAADLDGDGIQEIILAFAGEPSRERCPTGGGVTAWKSVEAPAASSGGR